MVQDLVCNAFLLLPANGRRQFARGRQSKGGNEVVEGSSDATQLALAEAQKLVCLLVKTYW